MTHFERVKYWYLQNIRLSGAYREGEREREGKREINKTDDGNIVLFLSGKCIKAGKQSVGKIRFGQKGGLDLFTACHSIGYVIIILIYIKKIVAIKFHHQIKQFWIQGLRGF